MISLTPEAAEHIRESASQGNMADMPLRVAVTRREDGSFHYALGFDDINRQDDHNFESEGIKIVVAPQSLEMLNGAIIDYVDLDGSKEIIFINPNDPAQQ
ncbi:iron-sulfur cluster assembly protein [Thiogranum longum]|uniref:Iron-sulfur cluster assembly protein n=1 Tax=Thiogranum longum TaxID=1537524 RepID=A0A4R1HGQ2_9GAMM|nr:iron-sulfur cluster assembly accessory protein [Thiogranum longum]TCK18519.1 iron-sulfur cluster assembly protein [Thiogranum longum]